MGNKQSGKSSKKIKNLKKQMDINQLLKNMFIAQTDITEEYLVKSPPLGKSDIGEIREVYNKGFKRRNIMKVLYLNMFSSKEMEMIINEVQICQKLNHPNILKIQDYCYDAQNIYIVLEYFQGKSLEERIRNKKLIDEVNIYTIFKEIVSLVYYLHKEDIVHRDLRLNNILFDGKKVKIDDFQKSKVLVKGKKLKEVTGNPFYVAPEILNGKYGHKVDVWALGVILYSMVFGRYPFYGNNTEETIACIQNKEFVPEYDFDHHGVTINSKFN